MNKLKTALGIVLGAAMLFGVGASLKAINNNAVKKVEASTTDGYSVIGKLQNYTVNSAAESWNYDHYLTVSGTTAKTTIKFKSGDEFKIRVDGAWTTSYGGADLGTVPSGFSNSNGNVKTTNNGWYDITFNTSTHKINISANGSASPTKRVYFDIDDSGVSWKSESSKSFKLYCHYYGGSSGSTWPGQSMMSNTITQFSRSIYYYDVPIDTQSIIFVRSPDGDTSNAWNRWNITNGYTNYRIGLGYNYFQPSWWDDGGTHRFNGWDDNATGEYGSGDSGGNPYTGYKAYNATIHVNATTTTELAVNWAAYSPSTPSISGQEFVGWCTNAGLTNDYTSAIPTADLELYAKFATSARIVYYGGTTGDPLALSATEWSVTSTFTAGQKFKLVKTFNNSTTQDYVTLQSGLDSIATSADGYITMINAGTYSLYLKLPSDGENPNKIYIMAATPSSEAYSFADFFLANIGCDPAGITAPTGWSTCATRYSTTLSDAAKNFIYSFDITDPGHDVDDKIVLMIVRYEWAIKHNPNNLSHFITNASGTARPISASRALTPLVLSVNNNGVIYAIAAISTIMLLTVGAYFFFKKGKKVEE